MSLSFRPVREEWGESCSCFVDADEVVDLLRGIANSLNIRSEHHRYADILSVWIEDGKKFLAYVGSRCFTSRRAAALTGQKAIALKPLVGNMKALASTWRSAIGSRGELHFYVDAF